MKITHVRESGCIFFSALPFYAVRVEDFHLHELSWVIFLTFHLALSERLLYLLVSGCYICSLFLYMCNKFWGSGGDGAVMVLGVDYVMEFMEETW